MKQPYSAKSIEKKWQEKWEQNKSFKASDNSVKEKCFVLDMFPYPSGDGLHVGHVENYTATDIYSRYKRLRGFEVMHPIGWDAFGLPAENFAIKTGVHPDEKTHQNIDNFTRQIKSLGISYDWSRIIDTSSPEYYKWTQWFFLFLYKNGLAYRKQASVNWCSSCQTVLANEQVVNGACERCSTEVMQKDLKQWFFKITDFIEDQKYEGRDIAGLINGLEKIDWPESTKKAQKHWIGRSEGALVKFKIATPVTPNSSITPTLSVISTPPVIPSEVEESTLRSSRRVTPQDDTFLEVFTTRVDTIFGCTYVVVAPEHALIVQQKTSIKNYADVERYIAETQKKTELERTELSKEKTGVKLDGVETINPFTGESVPVYVADYVLGNYGTGAVMAVPAHDERDFAFAKKYDLPIKRTIFSMGGSVASTWNNKDEEYAVQEYNDAWNDWYAHDGKVICGVSYFNGLISQEAREKMTTWLEEKNLGAKKVNYRLRDWLVSRQRYWGTPIPIIYCDTCGEQPVLEKDLPVKLPTDVDFRPTGESPLTRSESFHDVACPKCGEKARRESDTMDTFVCSSWYYLRFADPNNADVFADADKLKKWLPVDVYMGGAEHTVLHLLYARFMTKVLKKYGLVEFDEPFLKLKHQGMVMAEDGRKMSKSLGNVVNPDYVVGQFGADTLRLYEMFMGPLEDAKAWKTDNLVGPRRFLEKVWRMQSKVQDNVPENIAVRNVLHKTIKKVTEDIEEFHFNTVISSLMILANEMDRQALMARQDFESLLVMLSPLAPHITEELWESLGHATSIQHATWPTYQEQYFEDKTVEMVVQINGKMRAKFTVAVDISQQDVEALALQDERIQLYTQGKTIRKSIFIPKRLLNIVVSD